MSTRLLFPATIVLGSFLLFLSEPIAARQLLPGFGGSSAVWITCLVFFQAGLLLGYLYAHLITRPAPARWQPILHIAFVLAAAAATLVHRKSTPGLLGGNPARSIFVSLATSIGLPFIVLAATSPLLQVWYLRRTRTAIPFRFFALSNVASLLALLSYPTLIEPHLSLTAQRTLWSGGVLLFALFSSLIAAPLLSLPSSNSLRFSGSALPSPPKGVAEDASRSPAAQHTPLRTRLLWFLLPMAAAMQLSAITAYLTSNIAAIPLLWVLPLAAYLLTFILAFEFPRLMFLRNVILGLLAVMLAALGWFLSHTGVSLPLSLALGFFLAELFLACLFCHTEAYARRPVRSSETTAFYLILAAGSASGSFLVGIVFPLLFRGTPDLALAFLLTALLALRVVWKQGWPQRLLWSSGTALLVFLLVAIHVDYFRQTLVATRSFYGSLRVTESVTEHGDPIRTLLNGSIQHGTQIFSADLLHVPTTYYAPDSGVGLALLNCCANRPRAVGVVGLGTGTLASYGRRGDRFRFYEIDPSVAPIARNLFFFLRESEAGLTIIPGDARTSLAAEPGKRFDLLVLDAFSGDAIPLHLLTREAFAIYRRHLAPGGILLFHVSNQYVDLSPAIAQLAADSGLEARSVTSGEDRQSGESKARWVLVPTDSTFFAQGAVAPHLERIAPVAHLRLWTDDYSSILPLLRP